MTKEESKIMVEVHQAVFGVKHTEETGMIGDLKDIKKLLRKQNGRIRRLEVVVAMIIVSLGGGTYGLVQYFLGG